MPQDFPLSNMVRKTNFLCFSVLVSEIATFMSKKKSSLWISTKMLQNNRTAKFRVCGSLCGEKHFLLKFIPLNWFDQNSSLNKSKFSSGFFPFKHGKKRKLSEYFSARLAIVILCLKENFSMILPKIFKTTERHFSSMWLTLWRKRFFVYI